MSNTWNAQLQCELVRAHVDFETHIVVLELSPHHCTDMQGAIEYSKTLDSEVRRIETISGSLPDTHYRLVGDGWIALCQRESHAEGRTE